MQEVFAKRQLPETAQECANLNCNDCVYNCVTHARSIFKEERETWKNE